ESPDIQQISVYKEQEESGNYTAYIFDNHVNPALIVFNFESTDEAFYEVIRDLRFRQALSHAVDRDEINQTVYFGLAEPSIAVAEKYTTYDVELANQLLDEMGMTERDANGFRMTPSGKELIMYFSIAEYLAEHTTICELLIEYWAELDLNVKMEIISTDLLDERRAASTTMLEMRWAHVPLWVTNGWNDWLEGTLQWDRWYNTQDEFEGVEPPAEVKELYDLFTERSKVPTGSAEDAALYDQFMANYTENLWSISLFTGKNPLIISNDLCNIPEKGIAIATDYSMEQFFFCEGSGR
ncbi:MAG: hypothetical protein JW750_06660, partial [Anaerolineaceae bacterium]|nr:hypothetical protein [Anaerolineaceae bacterium]